MWRRLGGALVAVALGGRAVCAAGAPPSVIFVLLDTTRADRLTVLGNDRPTSPTLDALAEAGVLFTRHYANAHATRSSMPQLMSGRYYHRNILGPFQPDREPREYPFGRDDPTAALLPEILRRHGYRTVGVSAHWWVVAASPFGSHFDRLDLIDVDPRHAHADATEVTDRALELWRDRDQGQPLFLYLHYMDMHLPRFVPAEASGFLIDGYDWRARFRESGEPLFDRDRRRWIRADARDFTALDRAHFAAVYDARIRHTDVQLARLLAAVRADDPALAHTLVVVTADHGEELGEDGRTDHTDSLADSVQHIPWIMAGAGVQPGQRASALTAHVDVLPTLLELLGIPLPSGVRVDGRPQLAADGSLAPGAGRAAVFYAWEDYRAVRSGPYLLRQDLEGSPRARCYGRQTLYRVESVRRTTLPPTGRDTQVARRLAAKLARRLAPLERTFRAHRFGTPTASFVVPPEYWRLGDSDAFACVAVGIDTGRRDLAVPGWLWSGRGLAMIDHRDAAPPLPLLLSVPDGTYQVEAGVVPIAPMPWLFGLGRWMRKSFLPDRAELYLPLGSVATSQGELAVRLPPDSGAARHVVAVRLTPAGAAPGERAPIDPAQRDRLRALGYVD
jgi:arylsulfatase A-like enzyme